MAAEAAISTLVQMLGNLLVQKVSFLKGVEDRVESLKKELEYMQRFLKDAGRKQADDEAIRKWMSDLRELAYDAENVIEIFTLKVIDHDITPAGMPAYWLVHAPTLNRVGKEIESIRSRLDEIDQRRMRYGIQYLGDQGMGTPVLSRRSEEVERQRRLSPWVKDKDVVGLEKDVSPLLQSAILNERELGLSSATIAGMGGIGKSTLARKIYNHTAVTAQFNCRAWVVVSSEFKPEETIKQIMLQLQISQDERERLKDLELMKDRIRREEMLQEMLHKHLVGKRYFIVLDDVWEHAHWESLKSAFPDEQGKCSRLLLTSRNRIVTKYTRFVHPMKILDHEKSWELFLKKAFVDNIEGKCHKGLEDIGKKILEKCNGLPLAISVVGGVLAKQQHLESKWQEVLNRINSYLGRSESVVSAILELSYNNLPPQLKPCFLSLALFNEDAAIQAQNLVHIWIAQGLVLLQQIVEGSRETMEDIARGYLDELINRNMIQVQNMSLDDRVKTCYVHDLIRELSIRKAKEEINFEILRVEEGNSNQSLLDKPRHLAMYCRGKMFVNDSPTYQNKYLCSLFIHGPDRYYIKVQSSSYWKSFELLKLLDLEGYTLKKLPDAIGALTGLRYLRLRIIEEPKLPSSWSKLRNLQVIDFQDSYIIIPKSIMQKMYNLRHLYGKAIRCKLPLEMSSLKNLQTLSYVRLRDSDLEQVTKMTSLRKLGIDMEKISDASKLFTSLAKLENLARLDLERWSVLGMELDELATLHRITQLKLKGDGFKLPSNASNFPPNLTHLTLCETSLFQDPMQKLGKLQKLLYLKLRRASWGEWRRMEVSHDEFPRLERLYLREFWNLSLKFGKGAMPELKRFEIHNCPRLKIENLPEHLASAITYIN